MVDSVAPASALDGQPVASPRLPLSLYVHLPWCVHKCPYCDFNSQGVRGAIPEAAYVDALLRDLDFELETAAEARPLISIFIGGGTPSLFSGAAIGRLLESMAARLSFAQDIEITLEANPGTVDEAHFRGYRACGVNRLSIGVQSFDDAQLKTLGRIHDAAQARTAVTTARKAGFDNLNLDLMFALPGQTVASAQADLQAAIDLAPEHLSWYQLTIEPNTLFAANPPVVPDNDTAWDMQEAGQALLQAAGFAQYEVSAYARAHHHCRHNLNYWRFGDYLALGAGAHAKRSFNQTTGLQVARRARLRSPQLYLRNAGSDTAIQSQRILQEQDLVFEYAMNALRLNSGFRHAEFESFTGLSRQALKAPLDAARRLGLITEKTGGVCASTRGRAHLNTLVELFLP